MGQSSVEAAVLLPTLLLLLALLVQPVCVAYTKTAMRHAAAEGARVAATSTDDRTVQMYVLRRLEAVPEASPFHVGGSDGWSVAVTRQDGGRSVDIQVAGHLRPLPLLGVTAAFMGRMDADGLRVEARVCERVRPAWWSG